MLIHNEQFIWIMSIWVNVVFQDTVQLSQQATIIISVEQLDSMLLRICSVKDPRWHQNVVRTKKCHTSHGQVCLWCSYYILTYSVIYHCYHPLQHRIYLFYTIRRQNVANGERNAWQSCSCVLCFGVKSRSTGNSFLPTALLYTFTECKM